jgi:hypothetical protein
MDLAQKRCKEMPFPLQIPYIRFTCITDAGKVTHRVDWRAHPMEMTINLGDTVAISWGPVSRVIFYNLKRIASPKTLYHEY